MKDVNDVEIIVGDKVVDLSIEENEPEPDIVLEVGDNWVLTTRRKIVLVNGHVRLPLAVVK